MYSIDIITVKGDITLFFAYFINKVRYCVPTGFPEVHTLFHM